MSLIAVIGIAVGLAMDATAVATSILLGRVNRFAFHFGLFQAAMPVVGWFAGRGMSAYNESWDH